jgi:hypothetical protein
MGMDYGFLFQSSDLTRRKSELINYEYYEENPEEKKELDEAEEVFARTLSRVLPRLNLLGFTLETARSEYNTLCEEAEDISNEVNMKDSKSEYLTFEEFCDLVCRYPLADLNNDDLIELFDRVPAGTPVNIVEHSQKESACAQQ